MGDGTYAHSGYLGIRAAVAAKVNMTFKMLINDAVAMTGGQAAAGGAARMPRPADGRRGRGRSWLSAMNLKASDRQVTGRREQRSITAAISFLCRMICPASKVSAGCFIFRHAQLSCGGGVNGTHSRPAAETVHP